MTTATSDHGERYETRAYELDGRERVIGWSEDPDRFRKYVQLHLRLTGIKVLDRESGYREVTQ